MSDWFSIVRGIQAVKQAEEDFMVRHFVDENIIGPFLLDRVAEDLSRIDSANSQFRVQGSAATSDDNEQPRPLNSAQFPAGRLRF